MDIDSLHTSNGTSGVGTTDGPSAVIRLLNRGDELSQTFLKIFNHSITHVQTLKSAQQQYANLSKLTHRTTSSLAIETTGYPAMRQRTLVTLQQTGEEAQSSIRESLSNLERVVDQLSELLFSIDVYLSDPKLKGSSGFAPTTALQHLSALFSAHQAELISKRELFSSYNCEEIGLDEFVSRWLVCEELRGLSKETMDDLADVMGAWST